MIRSAVYSSATLVDRAAVHRALAASIDPGNDPDRHAWHLAAAANREDGDVAQLLEDAAVRGAARGAYVSSGRFLQRAMELTEDPAGRASRLLAAADAYLVGRCARPGEVAARRRVVHARRPRPSRRRAPAAGRQPVRARRGRPGRCAVLMQAAVEIAPFDVHAARATLMRALAAARA